MLREAQRLYTVVAHSLGDRLRAAAMQRKNALAKLNQEDYKVGDKLVVYRPSLTAKGIPYKAKLQFRGPYELVAMTSSGMMVCKDMATGKQVQVSRADVSPYTVSEDEWKRQVSDMELSGITLDETVSPESCVPGQYVALAEHPIDEEGSYKFQIGRFVKYTDDDRDEVHVELMGSVKDTAPFAFKNVWIDYKDNNAVMVRKTKPIVGKRGVKSARRWVADYPADRILPFKIALCDKGELKQSTLAPLGQWTPVILK